MIMPEITTVAAALLVLWASFCVGLLEILSAPERVNYPTARLHVRIAMFTWAVFLLYRGLEMLVLMRGPTPLFATVGELYAAIALGLAQTALLEHHLRSWLPAHTHQRIRTLLDVAACRKPDGVRIKGLRVHVK